MAVMSATDPCWIEYYQNRRDQGIHIIGAFSNRSNQWYSPGISLKTGVIPDLCEGKSVCCDAR